MWLLVNSVSKRQFYPIRLWFHPSSSVIGVVGMGLLQLRKYPTERTFFLLVEYPNSVCFVSNLGDGHLKLKRKVRRGSVVWMGLAMTLQCKQKGVSLEILSFVHIE